MGRPKKDNPGLSASDRIDTAFWELLKEMPFSKITIKGISERADVNHNTFYHYYENINDLAFRLIEKTIEPCVARQMAKSFGDNASRQTLLEDTDFSIRFPKVILLANSGSLTLQNTLVDRIMATWLQAYDIEESELTADDLLDLKILFRLIVILLGKETMVITSDQLDSLLQRDLGRGMIHTLMRVITTYAK